MQVRAAVQAPLDEVFKDLPGSMASIAGAEEAGLKLQVRATTSWGAFCGLFRPWLVRISTTRSMTA